MLCFPYVGLWGLHFSVGSCVLVSEQNQAGFSVADISTFQRWTYFRNEWKMPVNYQQSSGAPHILGVDKHSSEELVPRSLTSGSGTHDFMH